MNIILNSVWTVDRNATKNVRLVNSKNLKAYKEMQVLSSSTFKKHNPNINHKSISIEEPFRTHNDAFFAVFKETYKIWKENKGCSILFHDVDSVCQKNLDFIFDEVKHFMCFGLHDSKNIETPSEFQDLYFSCSLRYFPKEMNEECWALGFSMWEEALKNEDCITDWAVEQKIYNHMIRFTNSFTKYEKYFNINDVRSFVLSNYNENAPVYQYHGSRNPNEVLMDLRRTVLLELEKE